MFCANTTPRPDATTDFGEMVPVTSRTSFIRSWSVGARGAADGRAVMGAAVGASPVDGELEGEELGGAVDAVTLAPSTTAPSPPDLSSEHADSAVASRSKTAMTNATDRCRGFTPCIIPAPDARIA